MENKISPWRRFLSLLELDKKDIRQIFYYAIFAGLVALTLPLGIQAIINLIQGAQVSTSWIVLVVLVTMGVAFQGVLQLMQIRILENMQQKIFTRASFEFAYRFPKIKMKELNNYYPPELANRFFDVLTIQKGLSKILIDFPAATLQIIFGLILLSFYHSFFIIYGFLLIILIYVVFKFTAKRGLETSLVESKSKYKVAHWLQEIARSLISFKLSGNTDLAMKRNDDLTTNYLEARESHFKVLVLQFIQLIGFKVLVTAGLLIVGGLLVLNQQMNIGQFVAAEIIILLVIGSVEKLIKGLESFYDVLTSLEKIGQFVDKEQEMQSGEDPFTNEQDLHIEIDNLKYNTQEGQEVLSGIDFSIKKADRILFDGASGAGKTTLIKILSGLISPTTGALYINGVSIKGLWLNKYRAYIGQVLPVQSPFEGTILDNITFGNKEISQEHLHSVLKNLGLLSFIKEQPNGINTMLYPEGQQIPFTVSKRIVLARAIIHNPKLLLLKDPLEHFEIDEASRIIKYLTAPERPWALIISSQNGQWKNYCNQTIKISEGRITSKNTNNA
ncbi:ABC-type bacteriocin/lantibiotic exporter with double-glycine peptidase domain [Aquimarina sp. EL_43]|uniref:peptidase domain-containing ABC transporter n=1 Tax=unclassified Aquimarina TaxID=2627091 RepID=UPI0018C9E24F|nr:MULTISPECIES: ATP-binding cassette domain-containing protein [unclassified Aquimarina]MBG6131290.1 ABC-type bacteriocin/lantibiotic exporter with double-glycine peptidase domain [Aquimarina sp. EL_35]MBG6151828.1 ABC-type bacteriocin/lantibiotic exporter with double-glycine peptidase domain [Aquimarina sp. EL_32]MBG6169758.1 ABC-type bacteriocin/lantibiotic exporter with double-glycine peptidase domain [Aquimarina sp. EL_43]